MYYHEPCDDFHYLLAQVFFPHNDLPSFPQLNGNDFGFVDQWSDWAITHPTPAQWNAATNVCTNNDPTCEAWVQAAVVEVQRQKAAYQQTLDDLQFGPIVDLITSMAPSDLNEAIWKPSMFSILPNKYPDSCGFGFFYAALTGWSQWQPYWPFETYDFYRYIDENCDPFAFCDHNCTITTVEIGQGLFDSHAVNENMYQVPNMACSDSISINDSYFQKSNVNPPTQLVEQYYRCTPLTKDAASNAIGIASGWVGTATPIGTIFLSVVFFLFFWSKKALPVPLSKAEEEDFRRRVRDILVEQTGLETKQDLNEKVCTHDACTHTSKTHTRRKKQLTNLAIYDD